MEDSKLSKKQSLVLFLVVSALVLSGWAVLLALA